MKISAIICTYNREKYILQCLESIENQTIDKNKYEIILINNNSTDNTEEICNTFAKNNKRVNFKYFIERSQGLSYARNRGIKEASGEFLSFIDDDAIVDENFLEEIINFFDSNNEAVAVGGKITPFFEAGRPKYYSKFIGGFFALCDKGDEVKQMKKSYPVGANMSFRNNVFEKFGGFNVELGRKGNNLLAAEEKELFERLKTNKQLIYYLPEAKVKHIIPESRTKIEYIKKQALGIGKSEKIRISNSKKEKKKRYNKELINWIASFVLLFYYTICLSPSKGIILLRFRYWISKELIKK